MRVREDALVGPEDDDRMICGYIHKLIEVGDVLARNLATYACPRFRLIVIAVVAHDVCFIERIKQMIATLTAFGVIEIIAETDVDTRAVDFDGCGVAHNMTNLERLRDLKITKDSPVWHNPSIDDANLTHGSLHKKRTDLPLAHRYEFIIVMLSDGRYQFALFYIKIIY